MGLVNQIRDSRIATVESPHAEQGSNCAPSARRLAIGTSGTSTGEVQSQRSREVGNDAFKIERQLRWVEIRTVAGPEVSCSQC
jgi:hypothetical protein